MDKQEYIYNGDYVTIAHSIEGEDDLVVVVTDREELLVARKSNLQKKEDSWGYKRSQERSKELDDMTKKARERFEAISDKIVNDALSSLASRMKFNTMFGQDTTPGQAAWVVQVTDELNKLIKKDGPETVEKEAK